MAAPRRIKKAKNVKQYDRMAKARTRLILDEPFFATLLLKLHLIEDTSIPTAATDGRVILYSPEYTETITDAECVGLLAHELMHCVFYHMTRRGHRTPYRYNLAGDYVINPGITASGMTLPPGALDDPQYYNMTTEQVYDLLPEDEEGNNPIGPDGFPQDFPPTDWVFDDSKAAMSPAEKSRVEEEWELNVQEAVRNAEAAGKMPAGLESIIESFGKPQVNWRAALRRFFTVYSKRDYSWSKVKRRLISQNIYLPSLHSEDLDNLVIGVDTSGSVSDEELALFSDEINSILVNFTATVTVIYCDSVIQEVETFETDELPRALSDEFPGRGGTRLTPILEYIETMNLDPSCMVYLTDGGIWDNPPAPSYPVLIVTTDEEISIGENIKMER
jgi:predicted metal-dependent peptidase